MIEHPEWSGWLTWYAVERTVAGRVLVGGGGFKGAPTDDGDVELGYSLLPQFYRRGLASELATALVGWAAAQPGVRRILAQTSAENLGSQGVLRKLGFAPLGPGEEPGYTMYALIPAVPKVDS